jgi:hypothetical protein
MPRCRKCHSQWATYFRCPHCETKFPCPAQLFLVSLALPLLLAAVIYVLSSLVQKVENWQAVKSSQPVVEKTLTVEIDKSSVE